MASRREEALETSSLAAGDMGDWQPETVDAGDGAGARALQAATALYPLYVALGGALALARPEAFSWFTSRGPGSYSLALAAVMLAMGATLRLSDLADVVLRRPFSLALGVAAQYGLMPLSGLAVSQLLGLPPTLTAGLILLACCPGGTASNVVTYIANGDVPLSVVMTSITTMAAVVMTPLLTYYLVGAVVAVDSAALAVSTLQVVVAPVVIGACLQTFFPSIIARLSLFLPLAAVLISSLLASSVFSANVPTFLGSIAGGTSELLPLSSYALVWKVVAAVVLLHSFGFMLGYVVSRIAGVKEPQRRAISIEVGMQNSSLGVVLAMKHFSSPQTALPAALSAVLMNVMGSTLAVLWRQYDSDRDIRLD